MTLNKYAHKKFVGIDGCKAGWCVATLYNEALLVERERHLQAAPYERAKERQGYANGFKNKGLKTRVGQIQLSVPQVRDSSFYLSCLERGQRSERAFLLALSEIESGQLR